MGDRAKDPSAYPAGCVCGPCGSCDFGYDDPWECTCLEPCPVHQPRAFANNLSALHPDAEPIWKPAGEGSEADR